LLTPLKPSVEGNSAWHSFVVRARKRNEFLDVLKSRGIGHQIYYPAPLPSLKPLRNFAKGRCPVAEELARSCVALPLYPELEEAAILEVLKTLT
jgi:dTDP-4-amino-4,6-dideoxygalactose transaminase